jgi:hypothetical protein
VIQNAVGNDNLCIQFGYKTHLDFSDSVRRSKMNIDIDKKNSQNELDEMVYPEINSYSIDDLIAEI